MGDAASRSAAHELCEPATTADVDRGYVLVQSSEAGAPRPQATRSANVYSKQPVPNLVRDGSAFLPGHLDALSGLTLQPGEEVVSIVRDVVCYSSLLLLPESSTIAACPSGDATARGVIGRTRKYGATACTGEEGTEEDLLSSAREVESDDEGDSGAAEFGSGVAAASAFSASPHPVQGEEGVPSARGTLFVTNYAIAFRPSVGGRCAERVALPLHAILSVRKQCSSSRAMAGLTASIASLSTSQLSRSIQASTSAFLWRAESSTYRVHIQMKYFADAVFELDDTQCEAFEGLEYVSLPRMGLGVADLIQALAYPPTVNHMYAFSLGAQVGAFAPRSQRVDNFGWGLYTVEHEIRRQGIPLASGGAPAPHGSDSSSSATALSRQWRVSLANQEYSLCRSYPAKLVVPAAISDATLREAALFRTGGRIPVLSYWYGPTRASICRSAQPEVGIRGARNTGDEQLVRAIRVANAYPTNPLYIADCRSMAAAVGNRVMGRGYERPDMYENSEVVFMHIDNIHSVRSSYDMLRDVSNVAGKTTLGSADRPGGPLSGAEGASSAAAAKAGADPRGAAKSLDVAVAAIREIPIDESSGKRYLSSLEGTNWLLNLQTLLSGAKRIARAVAVDGASVLVHCSDGWDRTPQVISLAQILLDPFFRTMRGFAELVDREWCAYGHNFAQRCGHGDGLAASGRTYAPIFLQWLDAVFQLTVQFPTTFEFNDTWLCDIVLEHFACRFGTFLFSCEHDRVAQGACERTVSVWSYMLRTCGNARYANSAYSGKSYQDLCRRSVADSYARLDPDCAVRNLVLWKAVHSAADPSTARRVALEMDHADARAREVTKLSDQIAGQSEELALCRAGQRLAQQRAHDLHKRREELESAFCNDPYAAVLREPGEGSDEMLVDTMHAGPSLGDSRAELARSVEPVRENAAEGTVARTAAEAGRIIMSYFSSQHAELPGSAQ